MRRLLHFVARLYPNTWRKRYGAEFMALLEDLRPQWTDVFDVFRGGITMWLTRSKVVGIFALAGALATLAATYLMPKRWTAQATLSIQTQDGRPVQEYLGELTQHVFSMPTLEEIIHDYGLYRNDAANAVKRIARDVRVLGDSGNAFRVEFSYADPVIAAQVANNIVNRLVEGNMRLGEEAFARGAPPPRMMRVSVTEPARLPQAPNRADGLAIAFAGLAGGLGLGIVAAWLIRRPTAANA